MSFTYAQLSQAIQRDSVLLENIMTLYKTRTPGTWKTFGVISP